MRNAAWAPGAAKQCPLSPGGPCGHFGTSFIKKDGLELCEKLEIPADPEASEAFEPPEIVDSEEDFECEIEVDPKLPASPTRRSTTLLA